MSIGLVILFILITKFFSPSVFQQYDQSIIIFFLIVYGLFYLIHFILEKKLSPEKLVGKDLIFLTLKFLIPIFYAAFRQYFIENIQEKKIFLLHFLIYAILFLALDTMIYYQLINKRT